MKQDDIKAKLIAAGVRNLNEFGYSHCTAENILTDTVYQMFFLRMLEDNMGQRADIDAAIVDLTEQIKAA